MKKILFPILVSSLLVVACGDSGKQNRIKNHLREWVKDHEDRVYDDFLGYVNQHAFCNRCDTNWSEKSYQFDDSTGLVGKLSSEIHRYASGLRVTYLFTKTKSGRGTICLSANYDRSLTPAVDTIYNALTGNACFHVEKYESPDTTVDVFGFDNLDTTSREKRIIVRKGDLRVRLEKDGSMFDVIVFIAGNGENCSLGKDSKEYLTRQLFGEEIYLKKIAKVDFAFAQAANPVLPPFREALRILRAPDPAQ